MTYFLIIIYAYLVDKAYRYCSFLTVLYYLCCYAWSWLHFCITSFEVCNVSSTINLLYDFVHNSNVYYLYSIISTCYYWEHILLLKLLIMIYC